MLRIGNIVQLILLFECDLAAAWIFHMLFMPFQVTRSNKGIGALCANMPLLPCESLCEKNFQK